MKVKAKVKVKVKVKVKAKVRAKVKVRKVKVKVKAKVKEGQGQGQGQGAVGQGQQGQPSQKGDGRIGNWYGAGGSGHLDRSEKGAGKLVNLPHREREALIQSSQSRTPRNIACWCSNSSNACPIAGDR